jgi:hypothetical protein
VELVVAFIRAPLGGAAACHAEGCARCVCGWCAMGGHRYIWDGLSNGVILPHGDYTAQALHIKELAQLGVTVRLFTTHCMRGVCVRGK